MFPDGGAAEKPLERRDERGERNRFVIADVVDGVRRAVAIGGGRLVQDPHEGFDDVVDVSEIAAHLSFVEHADREAGQDGLGEQHRRHVGAAPRPVDREEAQARRRQPKEMAVAVRDQLVGLFRGRVKTDRVIDVLLFRKRQLVIGAVHARARRIHEVRNLRVTATFDDVAECSQVVGEVRAGIDERMADAGLRRQVDDLPEPAVREKVGRRPGIGQVHSRKPESVVGSEPGKPRFLKADVVIGIEIVDAGHAPSGTKQRERRVHADESRTAGHEHGRVAVGDHRSLRDGSSRR